MKLKSEFSEAIVNHKKKNEYKGSIFTITINTNKSFNSKDENTVSKLPEIKECFEDLAHNLFAERNLPKLIVGVIYENKIRTETAPEIKEINASTQIEANTDGRGFLHLHSVINVIHKDKVQINLKLLKAVVYKKMENCLTINGKYQKPFVGVQGRQNTYSTEQYVK